MYKNLRKYIYYDNKLIIIGLVVVGILSGVAITFEKWVVLGIIFAPLLIYLTFMKPFIFPFGVYVFLIPFDAILSITGSAKGTTLTKLLGIMTIIVLLFKGTFDKKLSRPDNAVFWWVLFVIIGVSSLLWAIQPESVLSVTPTVVGLLIFYLIISSYKIQLSEFNLIKWFILLGGLLSAIYTTYTFTLGLTYKESTRATISSEMTGAIWDPNFYSLCFIIPVSICIQKMLDHKEKVVKMLMGIMLGILVYSVFITGSRGGLLGIGITASVFAFFSKKRVTFLIITIVILSIILSVLPHSLDLLIDRWETAIETGGSGRLDLWYRGVMSLREYWAFGAGMNNFINVSGEFGHYITYKKASSAHNIYLGYLIELGIVGLALMIMAMWKHYKILRIQNNHLKADVIMLKGAFWGTLTISFFIDSLFLKSFWLLWMIIVMFKKVTESYEFNSNNTEIGISEKNY